VLFLRGFVWIKGLIYCVYSFGAWASEIPMRKNIN